MVTSWPKYDQEFISLMEEIDLTLQQRDIPIPYRQVEAVGLASDRLGCPLSFAAPDRTPKPGAFEGEEFSLHLYHWIKTRYGDKLRISLSPGRMAFLLRGDVWVYRFQKVYGTVEMFCSATAKSYLPNPPGRAIPRFNMLDAIEDLPGDLRASLSMYEVEQIGFFFLQGYTAITRMEVIYNLPLVRGAMSDHDAVVQFLTSNQHFGQSKWSSLQATEKMLKGYIALNGKFDRIHKLEELAEVAEQLGSVKISRIQLSLIQCNGGIRYGEKPVDCTEALTAHHASLSVSGEIALCIMRKRGIPDDTVKDLNVRRAS